MDVLWILSDVKHTVLYQGFNEIWDDPCHFSSLFMVLRNTLRLLQVFKCKCLNKLDRNLRSLDQSRDDIDWVETDVWIKDTLQVVSDDGVISQFNQVTDCDKRVVVDEKDEVFRSEVEVKNCICLVLEASIYLGRLIFGKMAL